MNEENCQEQQDCCCPMCCKLMQKVECLSKQVGYLEAQLEAAKCELEKACAKKGKN